MDNGWIKIHRKLLDWEWYTYSEMVHLFIHLIVSASHRNKRWQGVDVKRGQLITGRKKLSVETGISEQTIRTCLERLQNSNEIIIQPTNKYSIITICNYECYQEQTTESNQPTNQQLTSKNKPFSGSFTDGVKKTKKINQPTNQQENTANPTEMGVYDNEKEHTNQQTNQQLTSNQPATNQQLTTNKNDKNVKNEKKINIPLLEDFLEYAVENKPKVDTDAVRLKYESWKVNNWRDGNDKPIKNWKSKLLNTLPHIKEKPTEPKITPMYR